VDLAITVVMGIVIVACGIVEWFLISERLSGIMGLVKISQEDLDTFATAISQSAREITESADILTTYIQKLLAGQETPLPEADETAVREALSLLSTGTVRLNALEPPAAPEPTN
jgi:hypothetical protein